MLALDLIKRLNIAIRRADRYDWKIDPKNIEIMNMLKNKTFKLIDENKHFLLLGKKDIFTLAEINENNQVIKQFIKSRNLQIKQEK